MKERTKLLLIVGVFLAAFYVPWSHPVKEAVAESGVDADIEKVTDVMKIAGYGVMGTPAVVVDGEVKSVGKIPSKEDVKSWIGK